MITWGGSVLNILAGSWSPSRSSPVVNEVQLLPNPASPTAVASVLQQGGRMRHKARGTVKLVSMAAYNALLSDLEGGTVRTLADGDTINASFIITDLGDPKIILSIITADVTFTEA